MHIQMLIILSYFEICLSHSILHAEFDPRNKTNATSI